MLKLAPLAVIFVGLLQSVIPARAQDTEGGSFVGTTKASPGCPSVVFHVLKENEVLSGVVFFADGTGVSSLKGATSTDGINFKWHQNSISGKGPLGNVTGTLSPAGALVINLTDSKCTFAATLGMLHTNG